jgi:hypothetical protein
LKIGFTSSTTFRFFEPELSRTSTNTIGYNPDINKRVYDEDGCLLVRDGTSNRRICGVWTLPDGYLGRTGNQIIQDTVQQYLAERVNYAYIAPPSILDAGQTLHHDSNSCPNGLTFPRHWTFGEHLSVRSQNEQREILSLIAERKSIPRLIVAAWF